jgi:hypothetical protein
MQNIDPLYFITPITVIAFSFGLVIYWHYKRCFTKWALLYSLLAYAGAIALKYIVQIPTIGYMDASFGNDPAVLGVYYGVQTALFEVGGAFLVAQYAVSRKHFTRKDAGGYGIGLAFWENGVLIGLPLLLNYVVYYAVLSTPGSSIAATLYATLIKDFPGLFLGPSAALPQIGFAILERISSLLAHLSWGLLAVYSAVFRKKIYLALALPIGFFIDFLVPFAPSLGTALFELIVFLVALVGLIVAVSVARRSLRNTNSETPTPQEPQTASLGTLSTVNFKRSINYGKIYLIIAIAISIGEVLVISLVPSSSQTTQAIHNQGQNLGITNVGALVIVSIYPVFSPLFTVIGSLGALMIFVSDKSKGVYEYLIAYGVNTSSIFWSIVLAAVGLASLVLVVSLSVVTAILYSLNHSIPFEFVELILIYSIPLTYAATMFTTMIGMVWSSLTTRRAGINSPVGLAPIFGIFPIIAVFILSEFIPATYVVPLVGGVALGLIVAVAVMIAVSNKKMVRERFISTS